MLHLHSFGDSIVTVAAARFSLDTFGLLRIERDSSVEYSYLNWCRKATCLLVSELLKKQMAGYDPVKPLTMKSQEFNTQLFDYECSSCSAAAKLKDPSLHPRAAYFDFCDQTEFYQLWACHLYERYALGYLVPHLWTTTSVKPHLYLPRSHSWPPWDQGDQY